MQGKPFLKWAGGKTQLLSELRKNYPKGLGGDIKKYCEPFVGGGSVLIDILQKYSLDQIIINDLNTRLINCYQQIKIYDTFFINSLKILKESYLSLSLEKRTDFYLYQRNIFNALNIGQSIEDDMMSAALFIFLNKTCFNGLYRVNKKGLFNVPIGKYKNPQIYDEENLKRLAGILQNSMILNIDFSKILPLIDNTTFIYIDPPYRPLNRTSNFTTYQDTPFDDTAQIRLAQFIHEADKIGAKFLLSNSDPQSVDPFDDFFEKLYKGYRIQKIQANRTINSKGNGRGKISELLISNF